MAKYQTEKTCTPLLKLASIDSALLLSLFYYVGYVIQRSAFWILLLECFAGLDLAETLGGPKLANISCYLAKIAHTSLNYVQSCSLRTISYKLHLYKETRLFQ